MLHTPRSRPPGTDRSFAPRWANEPEPPPKEGSNKLKGGSPPPAAPRKPALPNRLPESGITVAELRSLAANTDYPEPKRLGLMLISMWLSRQAGGVAGIQARRKASQMGTEICRGLKTPAELLPSCFTEMTPSVVIHKAQAMLTVCEARLTADVKDLALSHVSSKCPLTAEAVEKATAYANRVAKARPNIVAFNATNTLEVWWPDFQ